MEIAYFRGTQNEGRNSFKEGCEKLDIAILEFGILEYGITILKRGI